MSKILFYFKQQLIISKKYFITFSGIGLLFMMIKLFNFAANDPLSDKEYQSYFNQEYKVFGLNIPTDISFANEKVPINDFTVREALDREFLVNTYWQSNSLLMHKRANRYLPEIEKILKKNGVPEDFQYLTLVESGLLNVVSPAGASGYWQLMEETAKQYKLIVNEEVDERYHLEKSTEAACKYLKDAYRKFNNWTLVAASYNLGVNGLEKQIAKQKVSNYYQLLLNNETGRYVYRILAIKEIISKPANYGFIFRKKDLYAPIPTYSITINESIDDLAQFAIEKGYNYRILKIFNPWLKQNTLTIKDRMSYEIQFPDKSVNLYNVKGFNDLLGDSLSTPFIEAQFSDSI